MFKPLSVLSRQTGHCSVYFSATFHTGASQIIQLKSVKRRHSKRHLRIQRLDHAIMPKAPKSKRKGTKFYAVRVGRTPGVYESWDDAEAQVRN
jgi:hypothetical protein